MKHSFVYRSKQKNTFEAGQYNYLEVELIGLFFCGFYQRHTDQGFKQCLFRFPSVVS